MSLADEFEVMADGVVRWRAPTLLEQPRGADSDTAPPPPSASADRASAAAAPEQAPTPVAPETPAVEPAGDENPDRPMTVAQFEAWEAEAREAGLQQGLEEGRKNGFAEGFEKGLEEGRAEGRSETRQAVARLRALHEQLSAPLDGLSRQLERELLTLAVSMAQQLVRREIQADPGEIVPVIAEALSMLPGSARDVVVHLHPDDAALVRLSLNQGEQDADWALREDPLLTPGGCRVESTDSSVDASLETRLAALMSTHLGGMRRDD